MPLITALAWLQNLAAGGLNAGPVDPNASIVFNDTSLISAVTSCEDHGLVFMTLILEFLEFRAMCEPAVDSR